MVDPWFDDVSKRWAIGCGRCGASSGRSIHAEGSKEAAIKSWNTRAPHSQSDARTDDAVIFICDEAACKLDARFYETFDMDERWAIIRAVLKAAPPTATTASEPVAWEITWGDGDITTWRGKERPLMSPNERPLYAAPPDNMRVREADQDQRMLDDMKLAHNVRQSAIEECAKIADAHKGSYAKKPYYQRTLRSACSEALASIRDEERGEDIASEMIAKSIRALSAQQGTSTVAAAEGEGK
jgi:hypothetical protein